jgi:hypothetical protein
MLFEIIVIILLFVIVMQLDDITKGRGRKQ